MGYVDQNGSWTKKSFKWIPSFYKSKDFMTIWSIVLHARHLVLHLRTTVDERSQLWEHWVLFFLLCLPSPCLNMNNRWRCDLPKCFLHWKTRGLYGILAIPATFASVRLLQLSSTSVRPHLASISWPFTLWNSKSKSKALPRALLAGPFFSGSHINSSLSHSHE